MESGDACAVISIEHQSQIDLSMAIRTQIYDAYTYDTQLGFIRHEHNVKKDLKKSEFIAGFSHRDRILPCVTVVVYVGRDKWSDSIKLSDAIDFYKIPDGSRKLIRGMYNDSRLRILDVRHTDKAVFENMKTDMKHLFMMIRCTEDKDAMEKYISDHADELKNLDEDIYRAIASMCSIREMNRVIEKARNEYEGGIDMCKAYNELKNNWKAEGKAEGEERIKR